ncbi:MAG: hypothetical protein ABTQ25_03505 [Nitrosomonas ureae]
MYLPNISTLEEAAIYLSRETGYLDAKISIGFCPHQAEAIEPKTCADSICRDANRHCFWTVRIAKQYPAASSGTPDVEDPKSAAHSLSPRRPQSTPTPP